MGSCQSKVEPAADTELHRLIAAGDWDNLKHRLEDHPDEASAVGMAKDMPLHRACKEHAPVDIVAMLLESYPEAVLEQNGKGDTPLHICCRTCASSAIVKLLLERYPEAVLKQNGKGDTPLHICCQTCAKSALVQLLLQFDPVIVTNMIRNGQIIQFNQHRSCMTFNNHGRLALHEACIHGTYPGVFRSLLLACPESLHVPSSVGASQIPQQMLTENDLISWKYRAHDKIKAIEMTFLGKAFWVQMQQECRDMTTKEMNTYIREIMGRPETRKKYHEVAPLVAPDDWARIIGSAGAGIAGV